MCVMSSPDLFVPSLMFLFRSLTPVERVSIYIYSTGQKFGVFFFESLVCLKVY